MKRNPARSKAAVLYVHRLIGEGIASLLERDGQLVVARIDASQADARERLRDFGPDAVVLEGNSQYDVLSLLEETPEALVIWVRPGDNTMELYRAWRIEMARAEDLLNAIVTYRKGRPSQDLPLILSGGAGSGPA